MVLPQLVLGCAPVTRRSISRSSQAGNLTLSEWLLTGKVDVAILAQAEAMPELQVTEIAHEEMVLISGRNARARGIVTAEGPASDATYGSSTKSLLAIASDLLKHHGVRLHIELTLNNLDAVREMVQQSMCCTIFPYAMIRRDYENGLIAARRILAGGLHRRLAIGVASDRPRTAAMDSVIRLSRDIITETCAGNGLVLPCG